MLCHYKGWALFPVVRDHITFNQIWKWRLILPSTDSLARFLPIIFITPEQVLSVHWKGQKHWFSRDSLLSLLSLFPLSWNVDFIHYHQLCAFACNWILYIIIFGYIFSTSTVHTFDRQSAVFDYMLSWSATNANPTELICFNKFSIGSLVLLSYKDERCSSLQLDLTETDFSCKPRKLLHKGIYSSSVQI